MGVNKPGGVRHHKPMSSARPLYVSRDWGVKVIEYWYEEHTEKHILIGEGGS